MRFVIVIPSFALLLIVIFFIGVTRGTPDPEALYPSPKNAEEYLSRGRLYEKHGRYEEALADYTQAAKLDSTNSSAYLEQGSVLSALNRPAEAIEKYRMVKQIQAQQGQNIILVDYMIEQEQQKLQQQNR